MSNTPQAAIDLAVQLHAHDLANGTLKRPAIACVPGRISLKAGEVTWRDYLPDARRELLRRKRR
jgi:hypothetical protein